MRFLITGVNGFVGLHLARRLLAQGIEVAGTYFEEAPPLAGIASYEADLLDRAALARVIAQAAPDVVVNLAGLSHVGESWQHMPDYFRVNVLGTENVLAAAAGRRVVVASSAEVYGVVPEGEQPIGEQRQVAPRTPYALTKAAAERLALGAGAVVARSFNLVGAGQSPRFALPAFAAQLAAMERGERPPVLRVGNLAARRDFVHVDDGAAGYQLLAERGRAGEIYNMASGVACSIAEALALLLEVSGVPAEVEPDPERIRPIDLPLLLGDARRLRELGWTPRRDLRQAIVDIWEAVRSRPAPALHRP